MCERAFPLRSRASIRTVVAALALLTPLPGVAPAAEEALDLEGDWYLLIHFRDQGESELVERWDDRIWRFERRGSRLRWTEYPLAIFGSTAGRFEKIGGANAQSATFWEPNDVQRDEIRSGLRTRSGGERTKTLQGSVERGYSSAAARAAQSTSVIGYSEVWRIEAPGVLPVFSQEAEMGAEGRAEALSGETRYSVTESLDGGAVLTGTYERDASRRGTFRLYRTPKVKIARK